MRWLTAVFFLALLSCDVMAQSRIKDIAGVRGVRDNQLVGYGLVIGLNGTGDSLRNAPFTDQSIQSMLDRMGVNVRNANARTRNVAAVIVTADMPAFVGPGSRIDATISSLGDSSSLLGGTLIQTQLNGADGQTYAVAQGQLLVSGFSAKGAAESVTQGVPTTGRIPGGAIVEREIETAFDREGGFIFELRNPDFNTAARIADAINSYTRTRYGKVLAREINMRSIAVNRPDKVPAARFMADLGELEVKPDTAARVVVDVKSGTIVMGRDVRVSTVAVTQGNLTVRITEDETVSQPNAFSEGRTVVTPRTAVNVKQEKGKFAIVRGSSLDALVRGLNSMGLKPADVISILQAIKSTGAMQAELVVQ
ncbi:MAG: flagellar basal body P-ring protein FlgI [Hyphomicrobium sp.]